MIPLANHLWQSTAFAAAAGALTLAFRRNHAAVRYNLWLAASLKFLVPFSLIVAAAAQLTPPAKAVAPLTFQLPSVVAQISWPFDAPSGPVPGPSPSRLPALLFVVWGGGAAWNLASWTRHWLRVRAALRTATPVAIDAPIPVRSTDAHLEPGIFGIFRPVLLLPDGITERLDRSQLAAVLVHEMCHVRRRDNLFAALHMLVEAAFWFHPLVWWIEARMIAERERACDEEVLRHTSDPESYAEGILNVCKLYTESPLACVSGVTGSDLKIRIEQIMTGCISQRLTFPRKVVLAGALLAVAGAPIFVGILHAQSAGAARFEVASIKPSTGTAPMVLGWDIKPGGRFHTMNLPVNFLIAVAYDIPFQSKRLSGGDPDILGLRYDIDAEPEKGAVPPSLAGKALDARVRPMLQALLADRFHLVIHRDSAEMPVYALTRGSGELKMKRSDIQEKDCGSDAGRELGCHSLHGGLGNGIHGPAADLDDVALCASNWSDRPIVNRTGIEGLFVIDTDGWAPMIPRQPRPDGAPDPEAEMLDDPSRNTIFGAFSQLGLKLVSQKAPVDVYTIQSVQKPTAN